MFSVLVIRLRSLRLLRVSGIVMRLRMFLLLITFLKASHSFRNRLLVICKNAYLFATMIMTSVSSPFSCCRDRKSGSAGMPRPISYAVFCLKKKKKKKNTIDRNRHLYPHLELVKKKYDKQIDKTLAQVQYRR